MGSNDEDQRYWWLDTDVRDGHPNAFPSGETHMVVDEEAGGVIAYTMDRETAILITNLLNNHAERGKA